MNKRVLLNTFILLLVSASCLLALKYISSLKENISSLKEDVSSLENQKQNLLQEIEKEKTAVQQLNARNAGLKDNLKSAHKRLNKSFADLDRIEEKFNQLDAQFSILKAENNALLEEREKLARQPVSGAKVKIEVTPASRQP